MSSSSSSINKNQAQLPAQQEQLTQQTSDADVVVEAELDQTDVIATQTATSLTLSN
jgi:hypothetical protein